MVSNPDLKLAWEALKSKQAPYTNLYNYYRGYHPLKYSTTRLKKAFEKVAYFSENWIGVIVEAVLDRLSLKGFDVSDNEEANKLLDALWRDNNIQLIADDAHEAVAVTGEGFIIALPSNDTEEPIDIYFNDPRMCHVFYEYDRPNKKRLGVKLYVDDLHYPQLVLYYADHFEYYTGSQVLKDPNQLVSSWTSFIPNKELSEERNDAGVIPVFHFATGRFSKRRPLGPSEISLQDAVNKLLTDMMVAAEFNSFVQRVIISQADPGDLLNQPGSNWWIPSGDGKAQQTQVLELGGRPLDGFLTAIDKLATALGVISRTPKHYFFSQGGDPSGEALLVMESPLTKKVMKIQEALSVEWQQLGKYLLLLNDISDVKKSQVMPQWAPITTLQPKMEAETVQIEVASGIPLKTSLRRGGWVEDEIVQMEADKVEEEKKKTGLAQNALNEIRAMDARSNTPLVQPVQPINTGG